MLGPVAGFVFVLLIVGYFVQSRLPPPKPRIIGIDLGTTFSCVGIYNAVSGNVTVLDDEDNNKLTPSVVFFGNNSVEIGRRASSQSEKYPSSVLYDAKRFIGKKNISENNLEKLRERYPFKILKDKSGSLQFSVSSGNNVSYFQPEDIGALILAKLKKMVEKKLDREIKIAVISVPAEFDELQRNATIEAGRRAGLKVLRLINEPTAAALAYGLHKKKGVNTVMVVDFGGGTLDVSLLNVQGGMFYTMAMAGNNRLGGQDVNQNLLKYLHSVIMTLHKVDISDPSDLQKLRSEVENIKINLTYNNSVDVNIDFESSLQNSSTLNFQYTMTRQTFDKINVDIFNKVLEPVRRVLKDVEISNDEVDEVVLVGGSTRIPRVRSIIEEFFGKKPNVEVDPELAVVTGVAIQAGILGGMWPLQVAAIELPTNHIRKIEVGKEL